MNAALVIAIVQAVLTYGPNAVIAISNAMQTSDPTPEQIKALFIDKEPVEYFK